MDTLLSVKKVMPDREASDLIDVCYMYSKVLASTYIHLSPVKKVPEKLESCGLMLRRLGSWPKFDGQEKLMLHDFYVQFSEVEINETSGVVNVSPDTSNLNWCAKRQLSRKQLDFSGTFFPTNCNIS